MTNDSAVAPVTYYRAFSPAESAAARKTAVKAIFPSRWTRFRRDIADFGRFVGSYAAAVTVAAVIAGAWGAVMTVIAFA